MTPVYYERQIVTHKNTSLSRIKCTDIKGKNTWNNMTIVLSYSRVLELVLEITRVF